MPKPRIVRELLNSGKDPAYFINNYAKIQHPTKGLIDFNLFDYQKRCIEDFINNKFNIVLKARQLGITTVTAAYITWLILFHKGKEVLVIATKKPTATNFIRKVKTIIKNLPKWMLMSQIVTDNTQMIEFENGSFVKAVPTSEDAGRSEGLSYLIIDEAAWIKNFDDLWPGLYSTLSTGGRCIVVSTPKGTGGLFHKLYSEAELELNDFNSIKLPWYVHPERDDSWFTHECKQLGSKRKIGQELLCDFASSGDTFLSADDLDWLRTSITNPIDKLLENTSVWIWKYPLKEHRYIIPADIARGDSKDFSAFHVIDVTESEIVAEYKGRIPPDRFGELLNIVGRKYENALICPENNTGYAYATCTKLQQLNYPKIYVENTKSVYIVDYIPKNNDKQPGFNTNPKTRIQILSKLEEIIRNKQIKIYSNRLYDELKTFIWSGTKAQAAKNYNDDLVISLAIGVWLYDTSPEYSKQIETLNKSIFNAIEVSSRDTKSAGFDAEISTSINTKKAYQSYVNTLGSEEIYKNFRWLY